VSSSGVGVRIAPSPFVRDVLTSALTALLTMGSLVLVTGWLAAGFGPAGFAVYALARRVVSLAAAVAPAPLALALARAQAGALTERERDAYLCAGALLALLAGLYAPDRGSILLDGKDLREHGLPRVREMTGVVFQSPHLFEATIDENIRMGRWNATPEDVREAARLAHADEFISSLPEGYRTGVRWAGSNFSGGQVQRIALARALVGRPKLLLLDEATGNLDAHTEAAIWDTLSSDAAGCTRVFITHRLSTTARVDRVVVMERGRVAEAGTFQELLRREGAFYKLWKRQVAGAEA